MRFRHPDGSTVHLAYCTNMHPAEDVDGIIDQLDRFAGPTRAQLGWPLLGVGLWIPAPTARQLAGDADLLQRLRAAVTRNLLEVVTLNAFPYESWHAEVVKQAVMHPNWTTQDRLDFTLNMARVLVGLLPDDVTEGTVATLPIGWRTPDPRDDARPFITRLIEGLVALREETGRTIRVAFEPEPGCIVETTTQAIDTLSEYDLDWVGLCYDACHSAVQFEDAGAVTAQLREAAFPIVKAGLSSALKATDPKNAEWLSSFVEPRYYHQVRELRADGSVIGVDDLDQAIAGGLPGEGEWRIHYHTPIDDGADNTTQADLAKVINVLVGGDHPITTHLEVETYTWTVLPPALQPTDDQGLVDGIAREMKWAGDQLEQCGLRPLS